MSIREAAAQALSTLGGIGAFAVGVFAVGLGLAVWARGVVRNAWRCWR